MSVDDADLRPRTQSNNGDLIPHTMQATKLVYQAAAQLTARLEAHLAHDSGAVVQLAILDPTGYFLLTTDGGQVVLSVLNRNVGPTDVNLWGKPHIGMRAILAALHYYPDA